MFNKKGFEGEVYKEKGGGGGPRYQRLVLKGKGTHVYNRCALHYALDLGHGCLYPLKGLSKRLLVADVRWNCADVDALLGERPDEGPGLAVRSRSRKNGHVLYPFLRQKVGDTAAQASQSTDHDISSCRVQLGRLRQCNRKLNLGRGVCSQNMDSQIRILCETLRRFEHL